MDKSFRLSANRGILALELCIAALVLGVSAVIFTLCWWTRHFLQKLIKTIRG